MVPSLQVRADVAKLGLTWPTTVAMPGQRHPGSSGSPLSWIGHALHAYALLPRTALVIGVVETYPIVHLRPDAMPCAVIEGMGCTP